MLVIATVVVIALTLLDPSAKPSPAKDGFAAVFWVALAVIGVHSGRPPDRIHLASHRADGTGPGAAHLDGDLFEGELVWADSHFVKLRNESGQVILSKAQIGRIEALEEPLSAAAVDVAPTAQRNIAPIPPDETFHLGSPPCNSTNSGSLTDCSSYPALVLVERP